MFTTIDICERLAEKLSDPSVIESYLTDNHPSIDRKLNVFSLANGWPGVALFYYSLNALYPDPKFERLSHTYLERSMISLTKLDYLPISLYQGLGGLSFVVEVCSNQGERYEKLRSYLDQLFIHRLEEHLSQMEIDCLSHTYTLANGISGVVPLMLLKRDNPQFHIYFERSLSKIIEIMNQKKNIEGYQVPGWYESHHQLFHPNEQIAYPKGKLTLGLLTGAAGLLSALSIVALEGIQVEYLIETISLLAQWLMEKQIVSPHGIHWPSSISFEQEIGFETMKMENLDRSTLFIARSLYLAGKVLNRNEMKMLSEKVFLSMLEPKPIQDDTFYTGRAGRLALTYRMSQETNHYPLLMKARQMEWELCQSFNPNLPLGFCMKGNNDVGLLSGVVGIALALLTTQGNQASQWERLFFVR